jgi:ABC-type bacteriocin/lantibiotic exporters, contain an N-terminal double-glycine peptidase domain
LKDNECDLYRIMQMKIVGGLRRRFPICIQHDAMDCGAACVKMLTDYYGHSYSLDALKSMCNPTREGVSLAQVAKT